MSERYAAFERAATEARSAVVFDVDSDPAVDALRARVQEARGGEVWLATGLPRWIAATPWNDETVALALSLAASLADGGDEPIDRATAHEQAAAFLAKNLAYGRCRHMTDALAAELAGAFVALFPDGARFMTNHDGASSWSPATSATFDWGIWGVHESRAGLLVVGDED